jgi:DNA polymerase III subunit delta
MPALKFNEFSRALAKGTLAPAYFFHGPEEMLKEERAARLLDVALDPASREFNFEQRSAADLDPESLHALLQTLPMFGGRRVIFLRAVEALKKKPRVREALLTELARPNPDAVVVLFETGQEEVEGGRKREPDAELIRLTQAVAAERLAPDEAVEWLRRRAGQAGVRFAEGAAEHLAFAVSYELGTLRTEIEKFSALGGETAMTVERVGELIGIRQGETAADWRNAVLEDDITRALSLLGPVLEQSGITGVKLVSLLGTGLAGLALARARLDQGDRVQSLASGLLQALRTIRPFGLANGNEETARWARCAPHWPRPRIRRAFRAALAADRALKGTRISDELGVVTDLVLELGGTAEGREGGSSQPSHPAARAHIAVGA